MYSAQSMMSFSVSLLVAAALVFGCLQWRRFRQRRRKEKRKRKLVMDTVQAAMASCSLFDLHVKNDKGVVVRSHRAQCVAANLHEASLILEGPISPGGWSGRDVQVYFRLASPEPMRFFDFPAKVKEADCELGYTRLILPLPLELGNGQRRIHERLQTTDFTLPGFKLWFGKLLTRMAPSGPPVAAPSDQTVPSSARGAPVTPFVSKSTPRGQSLQDGPLAVATARVAKSRLRHSLSWRPVPLGEVRVLDVSAGGAKLLLPSVVYGLWDDIRPGQLLLMQISVPMTHQPTPKPREPRLSVPMAFPVAFPEKAESGQGGSGAASVEASEPQRQNGSTPEGDSIEEKFVEGLVVAPMNLAIVGEVLRVSPPIGADLSVIRVAVRFRRWMRVIPETRLSWMILQPTEGISPLGQWIRRRINELATPAVEPALEAKDFDLCLYDEEED